MIMLPERMGAIVDLNNGDLLSPAKISEEVQLRAARLAGLGVQRRSLVFIAHGGSAHFFLDLFATWACGATAACLDPSLTAPEMENIKAFCRPQAILTNASRPQPLPPTMIASDLSTAMEMATVETREGDLDDPALLLFTSGTTGTPKGVVLSFRAILARLSLNVLTIGQPTLARTLVTLPTHFGHGLIGNALTALFSGGTIYLPRPGIQLAHGLSALIDEREITFMSSVPSFWHLPLRTKPPTGGTLQRVHIGSAPLSAALWTRIADWTQTDVFNCYGITETANWIAGASSRHGIEDGKVGAPWGGQAAIIDEAGVLHAQGSGEIAIQTPGLMSGYFDQPEATRSVLSDGWYRTGDIGSIGPDGSLTISGRRRDEINRAGMKIQPADLDMLLERHPDVGEACCFAMPDPIAGETVAIAIQLKAEGSQTAESLRIWCRGQIRREAVPERWFFVQTIPRTPRGKVSRDLVRNHVLAEKAGNE